MSRRSQRPATPKEPERPRTIADLVKLPKEDQVRILREELAGIERAAAQIARDRVVVETTLAVIEAT